MLDDTNETSFQVLDTEDEEIPKDSTLVNLTSDVPVYDLKSLFTEN